MARLTRALSSNVVGLINPYRSTGKYQGEAATQVTKKDKNDRAQDNSSIDLLICALKQAQITNQKSNLEEADS